MKSTRRRRIFWPTLMCLAIPVLTGCLANPMRFYNPGTTIDISLPLGLNGWPGILNPFGIVQALVIALVNTLAG